MLQRSCQSLEETAESLDITLAFDIIPSAL